MARTLRTSTRIEHWNEPDFRRAFEEIRAEVLHDATDEELADLELVAARIEDRMQAAGHADARVEVNRTVDEALGGASRWIVGRRERTGGGPRG